MFPVLYISYVKMVSLGYRFIDSRDVTLTILTAATEVFGVAASFRIGHVMCVLASFTVCWGNSGGTSVCGHGSRGKCRK
jgi:hypothetical protein